MPDTDAINLSGHRCITETVYASGGVTGVNVVEANTLGDCDDRTFPYSAEEAGTHVSTWTFREVATSNDVHRGLRTTPPWAAADLGDNDPGDHGQVILTPTLDKVVVYHAMPTSGNAHRIRFKLNSNPSVELGSSASDLNYPAVIYSSGNILRVFSVNNGGGKIQERTCDLDLQDCLDVWDWLGPNDSITGLPIGAGRSQWLEAREASNGRQFMIWQQKDSATDDEFVKFSERCGTGAWSSPVTVQTPNATLDVQSLLSGNPNISIDPVNGIVSVAWAAVDTSTPSALTGGDVWWARKLYGSCP